MSESKCVLRKAIDALLALAKLPAVKLEEAEDDHACTIHKQNSRQVEAAMMSVSFLLHHHPGLLKRFLLRAACALRTPPPSPLESHVSWADGECGPAHTALFDLAELRIKIEMDIEQEDFTGQETGILRPEEVDLLHPVCEPDDKCGTACKASSDLLPVIIKIEEDPQQQDFRKNRTKCSVVVLAQSASFKTP